MRQEGPRRRSARRRLAIRALIVAALAVVSVAGLLFVSLGRPSEREADLLASALDIRPGDTICEIGAGDGWLSVEMARRVGPSGHVYSTELDTARLQEIRAAAREAGLANLTVVEAAERATNLEPSCCDAIFMRRVYHHLVDPPATVADLHSALKPSGRLAIIEFESSGVLGAVTREGIDSADLIAQVTRERLQLVTVEEWPGPGHYVAVFRKDAPDGGQR